MASRPPQPHGRVCACVHACRRACVRRACMRAVCASVRARACVHVCPAHMYPRPGQASRWGRVSRQTSRGPPRAAAHSISCVSTTSVPTLWPIITHNLLRRHLFWCANTARKQQAYHFLCVTSYLGVQTLPEQQTPIPQVTTDCLGQHYCIGLRTRFCAKCFGDNIASKCHDYVRYTNTI